MSRRSAGAAALALVAASLATTAYTSPATTRVAEPSCPPGYELTANTGLDGGPGCHNMFELENPAELLAAADASAGPRKALHASDRLEAIYQSRAMMRDALARRARASARDFTTQAGVTVADSGAAWRLAGPLPIHADDTTYDPAYLGWTTLAGRVTALAVDPIDETGNTVYLGSAAGGVWKTTDGGTKWLPIGDDLPTLAIGAVAVNDEDGFLYVGTGEANTSSDSYAGAGAWLSPDGGRTWRELGRPGARVPADLVTSAISTAGEYVYIATNQGLYRSADRGATVTKVDLPTGNDDAELGTFVSDVDIRPGVENNEEVLAAVGWRSGKIDGAGLYRSTDAGLTWTKVESPTFGAASPNPDNIGRVTIAYPPGPEQDNRIVWAVIQDPGKLNNENNPIAYTTPASVPPTTLNGVYRSGDNGATWELKGSYEIYQDPATNPGSALIGALTPTYGPGIQAWYNQYVAVDPTNIDRVIVGLEEIYYTVANANVPGVPAEWRTAGRYWNSCTGLNVPADTCPPAPIIYGGKTTHPDQHAIAFAPIEGGVRVYAAGDGGVYSQEPDPVTGLSPSDWKSLNDTLPLAQPYAAAMGPDGTIWAGLQDNGTIKITPAGRADMTYGGDGFDVAVAPDDSDLAFSETPGGAIRRTTDGGQNWSGVTPSGASRQRFSTPFELDPLDGEHLVYGGGQVFETTSASTVTTSGWTNVFDLAEGGVPNAAATAIDVRGSAVYAGWCGTAASAPAGTAACNITTTEGGQYEPSLFARGLATNVQDGCAREEASTECWHQVAANGLPNRYIHGIAIDPADPKTVYVAMSTYSRRWVIDRRVFGGGSVYKSTDGGENFVNISGNLPRAVAADILAVGDRLVLATDAGVFVTPKSSATGSGTAWVPMGTGLPPVPAYDLSLNPQGTVLVAATHGRGIWTLPLTVPAGPGPNPGPGPGPGPGPNPNRPGNNGVIPTTGLPAPVVAPLVLLPFLVLWRRRRAA